MKVIKMTAMATITALVATACSKESTISIETETATKGDLTETVTATGTLESVTQVDVGTQVTGKVVKLFADYNSIVKKGELIAEIDKTLLESEVEAADANMESARDTYEYTKKNYERDKALHDKQLISDYEYETSKNSYRVAELNYKKSKADRVKAAENLGYAEIYAPIDGIVISREVEIGQTVVANMEVANIFTIADLDNMQVIGDVDEADIGQVKTGQRVTFTVDAYPDDTFSGRVTQVRLNPTEESNVVTYEVVVSADNSEGKLIPGLTANLTIYTAEATNVVQVTTKALKFEPKDIPGQSLPQPSGDAPKNAQALVWVLRDNKLIPTPVTTGVNNGINVEIKSGLKEGDIVATGYSAAITSPDHGSTEESSPFMPKPPGGDKKGKEGK